MIAKGKTTTQQYLTGATVGGRAKAATSNAGYTAAVAAAKIEAETAKKLNAAFKDVVGKNNRVIHQIQTNGAASTGESEVRVLRTDKTGKLTAVSKTASQYGAIQKVKQAQEEKEKQATAKLLNYGVVSPMTATAKNGYSTLTGEKATFTDLQSFKTVAQKAAEIQAAADLALYNAEIKNGGLGAASAKLNTKFIDTFSYKRAAAAVDASNKAVSKYIPNVSTVQTAGNSALRKALGNSVMNKWEKTVDSDSRLSAIRNWEVNKYNYAKNQPLNAAADVGVLVAESAIGGAALKGAELGLSAATLKALKPVAESSAKIANCTLCSQSSWSCTGCRDGRRHDSIVS